MTTTNKVAAVAAIVGGMIAAATSASAALNIPTQSCSYNFTVNMKKGTRNAQVMDLQKVLNNYPQTTIALSGAGSKGMETSYYGAATANAVARFQELHAADTLAPIGATKGTGNAFALTRAVLNQICNGSVSTNPTNPGTGTVVNGSVVASLTAGQPNQVLVSGVSSAQVAARLADFTFTGNGSVSMVKLMRTGISNNSTLKNVYLYDGATRISDSASALSDGTITFTNSTGLFMVNGSRVVTVRGDLDLNKNGQSVGVTMTGYTTMGASSSMVMLAGNNQPIASVDLATAQITNNQTNTNQPVNAGTAAQNVWDASVNVGTRAINLRGITFKYVGGAPIDSVANMALFVDGVKVGGNVTVNSNNLAVVDLSATPVRMNTGVRTLQLRGDIVKGSDRTLQFQVQNVADYKFEDSDIPSVFIAPTYAGVNPTGTGYNFTVSKGSVTVNLDPVFNDTKVLGGASNVTVGKFKLQAYGEDVKIETLVITPVQQVAFAPVPTGAALQNVTLYVNGGSVANSQNWTSGTLSFNLGSSLIVPAGSSAIVEVKADTRDGNGNNYTAGTVRVDIPLLSAVARGQSSQNTVALNGVTVPTTFTGRSLTINTTAATVAKTSGFSSMTVSPNTPSVKIGSVTISADSTEDVRVTQLTVALGGTMSLTNLSNLKVTDSSTIIGQPSASNSFTLDVIVPKNTSKTFEVMADLGSSATTNVTAAGTLSYRGVSSATTYTTLATGGVATISASTASIATTGVTKLSSSPVSQLVVGGSTGNIVTYNLKATLGNANATELTFSSAVADSISSLTVGGVTKQFNGTTITVTGLNIAVPNGSSGVDVPVTVTYGTVGTNNAIANSQATAATVLTLTGVKYTSGNTTADVTPAPAVAASGMQLVASKPVLTVSNADTLNLAAIGKIANVKVSADQGGKVTVKKLTFNTSHSGFSAAPTLTTATLRDGSVNITDATCVIAGLVTTCTFTNGYEIAKGTEKTFSLFAQVNGTAAASTKASVATQVTNAVNDFQWFDVDGNSAVLDGTNVYNFPTNSAISSQN
jgi:hypothetical protein